jgi:hypothetical protein
VIEGDRAGLRPDLIVVDACARGCRGETIAAGLRELASAAAWPAPSSWSR